MANKSNTTKVLVTGANGMLGSAIVRSLENKSEFEVIPWSRKNVDLVDSQQTSLLMSQVRPDYVIHCAALVGGIQANIKNPVDYLNENLKIDSSVINSAHENGIENLVYMGSSCMYPKNYRQPLNEKDILAAPLEETNEGYALSKIVASKLCSYITDRKSVV